MSRKTLPAALARGRRAPFTQLGVWIVLAPISPGAKALYWALAAHVNSARGDTIVWPSQEVLAVILGREQSTVSRWLKELVELGAVEADRSGLNGSNVYLVHETPPEGYAGCVGIDALYKGLRRRESTSGYPPVDIHSEPAPDPVDNQPVMHPRVSGHPPTDIHRSTGGCELDVPELDQRNYLPVAPPAPAPATPQPASQPEEEADPPNITTQARAVLDEVIAGLPALHRPAGGKAGRLAAGIAGKLAAGWTHRDLVAVLSRGIEGARSAYAVVVYRLGELGDPPSVPAGPPAHRQSRGARPWCLGCEASDYRWEHVEADPAVPGSRSGYRKCSRCHPDVAA